MDGLMGVLSARGARAELCARIEAMIPAMAANAPQLDQTAAFPTADINALRDAGALVAPFPVSVGGLGLGSETAGAAALCRVLRALGRGNLVVGRLYEAHVNAVRLITRYGTTSVLSRAVADVAAGHLIGLWVTDDAAYPGRAAWRDRRCAAWCEGRLLGGWRHSSCRHHRGGCRGP
jgi:alkylation response protein AidB-like acyl-CoA dehydrogenase